MYPKPAFIKSSLNRILSILPLKCTSLHDILVPSLCEVHTTTSFSWHTFCIRKDNISSVHKCTFIESNINLTNVKYIFDIYIKGNNTYFNIVYILNEYLIYIICIIFLFISVSAYNNPMKILVPLSISSKWRFVCNMWVVISHSSSNNWFTISFTT